MWLPTRAQVDAASRHAITAVSTAVAIFGLQAKGVDIQQVTATIQALGASVNDIVILVGAVGGVYATLKASHSASPTAQADAVGATGAKVVTTPEIAAATSSPNVISSAEAKVVAK